MPGLLLIGYDIFNLGDKDTGLRVMSVLATLGPLPERQQEITYTSLKVIGSGSFGVVYQAKLVETNEPIAIKKVLQDKRFKVFCFDSSACSSF